MPIALEAGHVKPLSTRAHDYRVGLPSGRSGVADIEVCPVRLDAILGMREEYRREMNCRSFTIRGTFVGSRSRTCCVSVRQS